MSEIEENKTVYTLTELTHSIQKIIMRTYTGTYWIKAEMNKLQYYRHSGHCYPELVEKHEERVTAQMKAIIWKDDYERINNQFIDLVKEPLKDGIKILFAAKVTFDAIYGLSLRIMDIDPAYTLGDLEKEKQETIRKLRTEGLFERNRQLKLALLPQRIAIISVETSKGYADFVNVLSANTWGYAFFHCLFPSLLQGEKAVPSIIAQLNLIKRVHHHFDLVTIIRGGGGDVGLACYNNYDLARCIAEFPLPVMTGIGHATNETVSEMIAFQNAITPTKLAEYLLQKFHNFSVPVQEAQKTIKSYALNLIAEEKNKQNNINRYFKTHTLNTINRQRTILVNNSKSIISNSSGLIRNEHKILNDHTHRLKLSSNLSYSNGLKALDVLHTSLCKISKNLFADKTLELLQTEKLVNALSPARVLQRGYSITLVNGKVVRGATDVQQGDTIETQLANGSIKSHVASVNTKNQKP